MVGSGKLKSIPIHYTSDIYRIGFLFIQSISTYQGSDRTGSDWISDPLTSLSGLELNLKIA